MTPRLEAPRSLWHTATSEAMVKWVRHCQLTTMRRRRMQKYQPHPHTRSSARCFSAPCSHRGRTRGWSWAMRSWLRQVTVTVRPDIGGNWCEETQQHSVQSVMREYLTDAGELTIRKMISQKLGYLFLKEFCSQHVPQMLVLFNFYDQIRAYEKRGSDEARGPIAREIYQKFIMPELLSFPEAFTQSIISEIQYCLHQHRYPQNLFQPLISEICQALSRQIFNRFLKSKYFTRFCQWKNVQLSIHPGIHDFRIEAPMHRHSFGKHYKCEKVDTGKM
ncbi:beta-adrenergic receptor kinase 1 isoform X4 [Rhincodon typus]|uniref:beta-adrenergic receptor kinase 1 isoform X4 n=1 Tax=Rhincodon typus TaxID=259920 RepID=UPI0020307C74|nr:beta-adrenergic receptor kinase 1 isoform X4 [Rhincodon typus]